LRALDREQKGQIAHLNRNRGDSRFENLVFLCLDHHDEYDSRTSQSKNFSTEEVRSHRNNLYQKNPHYKEVIKNSIEKTAAVDENEEDVSLYEHIKKGNSKYDYLDAPWRYSFWPVANEPEFFAFKAGNRCDGICLIERIDIPDGRVVIVCNQVPGNPGNSITNCVEELCLQVCDRFGVPPTQLVWLEHYEYDDEWCLVTFDIPEANDVFQNPIWTVMTPQLWKNLMLRPRKMIRRSFSGIESNVTKLFDWPTRNLI
jgi:hypothetical protein